jgi:hypothetical protein
VPEIPASGSARDLVEKLADRSEVAVRLLGERHVRGVLEHDELRVRQRAASPKPAGTTTDISL